MIKKINFSGYTWYVRNNFGKPGPCHYSSNNAFTDEDKFLHLKIQKKGGKWAGAEVYLKNSLGYGEYEFEIEKNRFLHPNLVLGLFIYQDDYNEIDIEFAQWGNPLSFNAQYAVQPYNIHGNIKRFLTFSKKINVSFTWTKDEIIFKNNSVLFNIHWRYSGKNIPLSVGKEKLMMNLWIFNNKNISEEDVIIKNFKFTKIKE